MFENTHYSFVEDHDVNISKAIRNRMSTSVNIAKAMFSKGYTSGGRTFNMCFAYDKSKLLGIGLNNYKRIMTGYIPRLGTIYKKYGDEGYIPSLHAEISCLFKLGLENCEHLDFYSIRIDRHNKCVFSKPCSNCARILHQVGFKHVYFFDETMKVKSL